MEMLLALEARIAELERQLGANSRNSNKPPSKDDIFRKPPTPKSLRKKTGRSGGQEGHPGQTREIVEGIKVLMRGKVKGAMAFAPLTFPLISTSWFSNSHAAIIQARLAK